MTDEALLAAINAALASFPAGRWVADEQTWWSVDDPDATLHQLAYRYQHCLRGPARSWPPIPSKSPEEAKARKAHFAAMSHEQKVEAYARTLYETEEDYQAAKAAEEKRHLAEAAADDTPWPLPSPPTTRTIRGEVVRRDDEPEPTITPLADRRRAKQPSIYGQEMARRRGELPDDADDESKTEAINEQLGKERRQRRRRQGPPRVFFR